MTQQLRDIMSSNVFTVNESQTVKDAAILMSQHNVGAIPVVNNNGEMTGIITDRDITLRTTAKGGEAKTPVSLVMSSQNMIQGTPDMDIQQAVQLLSQQQVRRLPVVENGQIVGMVALGDLAVNSQFDHEAEQALSDISTPSRPELE